MKKILILFLMAFNCYSQYKVCYDYTTQTSDSFGTSKTANKCYLYTDNKQSKFVKDRVINGQYEQEFKYPKPDLEEKFKAENKSNVFGDSIGYVVTKFFITDSLYLRNSVGTLFKEKLEKNYTIIEEFKNIYNYKCQKANIIIYGREFEVWFTSDIPVSDGPWKLSGLPRLVIEAHSKDKFHNFFMTSIIKISNNNYIYTPTPFKKIINRDLAIKEILELTEKHFKYRKSKEPNTQLKDIINDLDLPLTVFE